MVVHPRQSQGSSFSVRVGKMDCQSVRERQTSDEPKRRLGHLSVKESILTLVELKAWLIAFMYFGSIISYTSLPLFLPTILKHMDFSEIGCQGLNALPCLVPSY